MIGSGDLAAAAAHFLVATVLWPQDAKAHEKLGLVLAERGRYDLALASLAEARRRDPGRVTIAGAIAQVERIGRVDIGAVQRPAVEFEKYPSGVLRSVYQTRVDRTGNRIRHGLHTEWHEDGNLSRFVEYVNGAQRGPDLEWMVSDQSIRQSGAGEPTVQ